MIPRYSLPEMRRPVHRRRALRRVARGGGPRGRGVGRARRRARATTPSRSASGPGSTSRRSHGARTVTDHDVAAFVDVVQETRRPARGRVGALRPHVERRRRHRARAAADASASICSSTPRPTLESAIAARAREFRDTPMVGRTHGIHAEPTTFGTKLALWALQVRRDRERLPRARDAIAVGKLSGAVGTYLERRPVRGAATCASASGLHAGARHAGARARPPRRVALRVRVDRRDASSRSRSRSATCSAPRCARPRSRSARGAEGLERDAAQAQPDEVRAALRARAGAARQPAGRARRRRAVARARHLALVGRAHHPARLAAARLLRARAVHGRSSSGMRVYPERMLENLDASYGLVFSQPVLLALVEAGREPRRRLPDGAAQRDGDVGGAAPVPRRARAATPRSPAALDDERLAACFDLKRALAQRRPHVRRARRARRPASRLMGTTGGSRTCTRARSASSTRSSTTGCSWSRATASRCSTSCSPTRSPTRAGCSPACRSLVRADRRSRAQPRDLVRPDRLPGDRRARSQGRAMLVQRRGRCRWSASCAATCSAAAWTEYREQGTVGGLACPTGLQRGRAAPRAAVHADDQGRRGPRPAAHRRARPSSSSAPNVYEQLRERLRSRSTSSAPRMRTSAGSSSPTPSSSSGELDGEMLVIDEMMTPDSSRYWPAEDVRGRELAAVVRQAVRARLHATAPAGTSEPPAPHVPAEVIDGTRGAIPRGVRAPHRPEPRRLVRTRRVSADRR